MRYPEYFAKCIPELFIFGRFGFRLHAQMITGPKCDFTGIREKLVRAKQNILNLQIEIDRFLQGGEYPTFPDNDQELLLKAISYHKNRVIPLRFSVLAGEIIHHLRSCFDHIVWQFSRQSYREAKPTKIEFPVQEVRPINKKVLTGYERYVKGVFNPGALILIEMFQPHNSPDPPDSPLLIIHKMDIMDKHRELVLCASTGALQLPMDAIYRYLRYQYGESGSAPVDLGDEFQRHGKIVPQISFKQFGGREIEPVVQGLAELHNFTIKAVNMFENLIQFDGSDC